MAHANRYYRSYNYVFCADIRGWYMLISIIVTTIIAVIIAIMQFCVDIRGRYMLISIVATIMYFVLTYVDGTC